MVVALTPAKSTAAAKAPAATHTAAPGLGFTQVARSDYVEPILGGSATLGATTTLLATGEPIPAFGYMRHVVILVQATGGTGVAAVYQPDGPFSALAEVVLTDSNGQPIDGPYTGYDLYLINLFGGYAFQGDPKLLASYVTPTTAGNYAFALRIPVEITERDALGALANQNGTSAYKLRVVLADAASVYSTPPTVPPVVTVSAFLEAWTQPDDGSEPPYLGTTQVWSKENHNNNAGQQKWQLSRVGNALRTLILVSRDTTGVRSASLFPLSYRFRWDSRDLQNSISLRFKDQMCERYGYLPAQIPAGVLAIDFTHDFDGHPGGELRDQWLRTTSGSRIEVDGVFQGAGSTDVLVNDVLAFAGGVPGAVG